MRERRKNPALKAADVERPSVRIGDKREISSALCNKTRFNGFVYLNQERAFGHESHVSLYPVKKCESC